METTYDKVLSWYKKQPWWGKILFFGVLILPALLIALKYAMLTPKLLEPIKKISVSPPFGRVNEVLDTRIESAKRELIGKLETVRQVGVRATERRQAIQKATTMAELDELKKRFGL